MSDLEFARQVFASINKLRANPKSFVPALKSMLAHFDGKVLSEPGKVCIETTEGASAVSFT